MGYTGNRVFVCILLFSLTLLFQYSLANRLNTDDSINPECPWCSGTNPDQIRFIPLDSNITKLISPGDPELISSVLWLRTSYYFGSQALNRGDFDDLLFLLDQITDISPGWIYPYLFGSVALSLEARRPDDAFFLVQKGIRYHPGSWKLHFFKGFIYWKYKMDFEKASLAMLEASKLPGAPRFLSQFAASLASKIPDSETRAKLMETLLSTIQDPEQRKRITRKLVDDQ